MKFFLGFGLLILGFQCQASAPIDPACIKSVVEIGQMCIVGCEVTRHMIRSLHLASTTTNQIQLQAEQTFSCCNPYTICAVTCCLYAPTTSCPEIIGAGVSCSIIGCYTDYTQYYNTLMDGDKYKHHKMN